MVDDLHFSARNPLFTHKITDAGCDLGVVSVMSFGESLVLIILVFCIGLLKAGVGVGTGVFTSTILSLFMKPIAAIPLAAPLMLAADMITVHLYRGHSQSRLVRRLLLPAAAGTLIGAKLLVWLDAEQGRLLIGFLAIWFVIQHLYRPSLPHESSLQDKPWAAPVFGLLAGIFSGFAHTGGMVITLYFLLLGLKKEEFIASLAHFLLYLNLVKLALYIWMGLMSVQYLVVCLLVLPILYSGAYLARKINRRFSDQRFSYLVLGITWLSGVLLLIK